MSRKLKRKLILQAINNSQGQQSQGQQSQVQQSQGQQSQQENIDQLVDLKDLYEKNVERRSLNNPKFINFLREMEKEEIKNITNKSFLYPTLNDPNFNIKIAI